MTTDHKLERRWLEIACSNSPGYACLFQNNAEEHVNCLKKTKDCEKMKFISVLEIWTTLFILSSCTTKNEPYRPVEKPAFLQEAVIPTPKPRVSPTPEPTVTGELVMFYYARNCSRCHGIRREGGLGGRAPDHTPERLTQSDDFYAKTIKEGRPGTPMRAYAELSDSEIKVLVTFIKYTRP